MENKEPLMLINDLVVQFRAKGKKVKAVKGANLEIFEKETFAMVGESGSGKTTIGRAVIGIQPIKAGTVFMNNKIVIGQATNLYKLNQKIHKLLLEMEKNTSSATKVFEAYLDDIKTVYFKFIENKKYNPKNGKITDLPGNVINNIEDILEDMSEEVEVEVTPTGKKKINVKNKDSQLEFIKTVQTNNLKSLINIIRLQQIAIRFVDQLDKYGEEITKELHNAVRSKLKHTHVLVREVKIIANQVYEVILKIIETREKFRTNKFKSTKQFFIEYSKLMKELVTVQKIFIKEISTISTNQIQNLAISAPIKTKDLYSKIYNKMINVSRDVLFTDLSNSQKELLSKQQRGEEIDIKKLAKITEFLDNVWSFKTINFKALERFFKHINDWSEQNIGIETLQRIVNQFLNSDLEQEVKDYFENNVKTNTYKVSELILLENKIKHAKAIIKKNIVSDRELIDFWYSLHDSKIQYSDEEIKEYSELLEFLKLPSINEIASGMEMLKKPLRKDKKQNKKMMQMIFQDPAASLNDRMPVEQIICEGIENFPEIWKNDETRQAYVEWFNANLQEGQPAISLQDVDDKKLKQYLALNMLKSVGMLPEHLSRYPHEFSGGQRQRIGIARALVMKPKFIVADEPISALDVSIRAQVLNLLKKFQEELSLTYMFVAHDLSIVRFIADRIAVIYHGDIVEVAEAEELFNNPLHPYTRSLLSAIPHPDPNQIAAKKHYVYDPAIEHSDYLTDYPNFNEVKPGHFVLCNQREEKEILNGGKN